MAPRKSMFRVGVEAAHLGDVEGLLEASKGLHKFSMAMNIVAHWWRTKDEVALETLKEADYLGVGGNFMGCVSGWVGLRKFCETRMELSVQDDLRLSSFGQ